MTGEKGRLATRVLIDTSVWIDHLRRGNTTLAALLERGEVLCHPFVIGELACGTLRNRAEIFSLLEALPQAAVADHAEVLGFLAKHGLPGEGIGWIDAHLLASARLARATLWSYDRALGSAAARAKVLCYAE